MKLILKRAGVFKANWADGDGACGHGDPGAQEYNFVCEIESDSRYLDKNGFIVDQLEVNNVFQTQFYPEPSNPLSCEEMALMFTQTIRYLTESHMRSADAVIRITVGVGAIPPPGVKGEALITAEWVR